MECSVEGCRRQRCGRKETCHTCYQRDRYNSNPEIRKKVRASQDKYFNKNKEKINKKNKARYDDPSTGVKASMIERGRATNRKVAEAYGIKIWEANAVFNGLRVLIRRSQEFCQRCGSYKKLEVHHIRPRATHPHLALQPDNLVLLCRACHRACQPPTPRRKRGLRHPHA